MLSADALTYFLQVARRGRLTAAAGVLGVDHTTVSRQVNRLERDIGHRLFDRTPSGWILTAAGRELVPHAEAVETALRAAAGISDKQELAGTVRIVTPDAFGAFMLSPGIGSLRAKHRGLHLQIVTSTRNVALGMREFDVAVTLEQPRARHAVSRRLTKYRLALYATPAYLASAPPIETRADLHEHEFIWYVDDLLDIDPLRRFGDVVPRDQIPISTNNVTGHWQAATAGLGIAPLPCYLGDTDEHLVCILRDEVELWGTYWVAAPREHLALARVQAVIELLDEIVVQRRDELLGVREA